MSVAAPTRTPVADGAARARAKETLWRLAALVLAHPTPEVHEAIASGDYQDAFAGAWGEVTGRVWPQPAPPAGFAAFEAGYIAAFLHGRNGKPVAALLAGDHEELLRGISRPVFMLNVAGFYGHFGLRTAVADEGHADEPDHLSAMSEFLAVLCHLEAGALERGGDAAPPRRAQRDFLARYGAPTLDCVAGKLRRQPVLDLDATVAQVLQALAQWAPGQVAELEARVGVYRDPDTPPPAATTPTSQNLWG